MTFIILVKDVATFGSFKSIDFDGHENDKKSVGLSPGGVLPYIAYSGMCHPTGS